MGLRALLADLPDLPGAACRGYPEPLWDYHLDGEWADGRSRRHLRAITHCQLCPVRAACLGYGLSSGGSGVYGGTVLPPPGTPPRPRAWLLRAVDQLTQAGATAGEISGQLGITVREVVSLRAALRAQREATDGS